MKKYKLLQPLPGCPKGTESQMSGENYYFRRIDINFNKAYLFTLEEILNHPDFFEEVKPERWRPKDGETFYLFLSTGLLHRGIWLDRSDSLCWDVYNCFRTEDQAARARDRVRDALRKFWEEEMGT